MKPRLTLALALLAAVTCGCAATTESGAPPAIASSGPPPPPVQFPAACAQIHGDLPLFGAGDRVDQEPMAVIRAAPEYPDEARAARVTGVVGMWALVCPHGKVLEARYEESIPALDRAAATALSQWTFEPALRDGKPVAAWVRTPIRFSID